jgi:hypothetical protein
LDRHYNYNISYASQFLLRKVCSTASRIAATSWLFFF